MTDQQQIIEALNRWIDSNLSARLSVDKVAERSGYSKWHIQRMFSKYNQMTISDYIRIRLSQAAARELGSNTDSIAEIASRLGFNSTQTLCRTFRQHFHETPSAYRERLNRISRLRIGAESPVCTHSPKASEVQPCTVRNSQDIFE